MWDRHIPLRPRHRRCRHMSQFLYSSRSRDDDYDGDMDYDDDDGGDYSIVVVAGDDLNQLLNYIYWN